MQGRGVTNYTVSKPSHALTTATTEFDDALIQRGIVTAEQVMLAKGASPEEAFRLARDKESATKPQSQDQDVAKPAKVRQKNADDEEPPSDSDSFDDDEDDGFFERYRDERLAQLDAYSNNETVHHISRDDWPYKVNEASQDKWVMVTLLDSGIRRQEILQELNHFARQYSSKISFVTIEAREAVPNWPAERVPAVFLYREGIKIKEWVAPTNGKFPSRDQLEQLLQQWGILY
jgi:hypothetical protein